MKNRYKTIVVAAAMLGTLNNSIAGIIDLGNNKWMVNANSTLVGDPDQWPTNIYSLDLDPGTYLFSLVTPSINPNAEYTAWSYVSSGSHWRTRTAVYDENTLSGFYLGSDGDYASPQEAYNGAVDLSHELTFDHAAKMHFYFPDQIIYDNRGGASVFVEKISSPVPEPANSLLMALGMAMVFVLHRRLTSSSKLPN